MTSTYSHCHPADSIVEKQKFNHLTFLTVAFLQQGGVEVLLYKVIISSIFAILGFFGSKNALKP